jgi:CO/xanthine dehydrogenase FAD-binding subunit
VKGTKRRRRAGAGRRADVDPDAQAAPCDAIDFGQPDGNRWRACMSDAGEVCVGGATTHATVAREATAHPGLAAMAARIGDPAAIAGLSAAHNTIRPPESPAAALASGASIITNGCEIAADDYGMFNTAWRRVVTEVRFPVPENYRRKPVQPASRSAWWRGWSQICRWCVAVTGAFRKWRVPLDRSLPR